MLKASGSFDIIPDQLSVAIIPPKYAQGSEPANPEEGMEIWNLTTHKKRVYNGTQWVDI